MLTTVAPAKINWTLEVLGRRGDGYHEVRTLMQAIDLHDELSFKRNADSRNAVTGSGVAPSDDLIVKVLDAASTLGVEGGAVTVKKRIPPASGLGGGSSDAAATLRLLIHGEANLNTDRVKNIAAGIGSDGPFFLSGGTALAEGRGERITPLQDAPPTWIILVVPPISVPEKTRRMYGALKEADFTDGAATTTLANRLASGGAPEDGFLMNAFERLAPGVFPGLEKYRSWMLEAGSGTVHLSGAGPALFAVTSGETEARAIRARMTRPKMGERVYAVRTIGAAESTLTWDS
jgi:4-diphosphocytidyl-2-C-methyl-D-erythritol kinase